MIEIYSLDNLIGRTVPFNGKFIFLDVETANITHKDICQIGAIICDNGKIVNVIDELVKPFGKFMIESIKKHDITSQLVKHSPTIKEIWEDKFEFFDSSYIIVAHNAKFDLEALTKSLYCYSVVLNNINYIDTERLVYSLVLNIPKTELGQYSRENICNFFSIPIGKNHNALSDANDCLNIFCQLIANRNFNLKQFIDCYYSTNLERNKSNAEYNKKFAHKDRLTREEIAATTINEELDRDFAGKTVVLTGDFAEYPDRKEAEREVRRRGGKISSSVSGATNLLICGNNAGPSKRMQAQERQAQGQDIKIVDEKTFYKMLESNDSI